MEMIRSGKHHFFYVLLLVIIGLCLFGCGKTGTSSPQVNDGPKTVIRIGLEPYAPFDYLNESGEHTGIDVDIAREAFRRMGYEPQFVTIDWENRDALLSHGSIDCIWCCYSMNDRQRAYRWAGPYIMSRMVVAVNPTSDIMHISDLKGKRVAVRSTTKAERLLSSDEATDLHIGDLYSFFDRDLMYTSLYKGYVDAIASHEVAILQYMKDNQMEFRLLPEPLEVTGVGVAFAKTDMRPLVDELDKTLKDMAADGTTERILSKYVTDPDSFLKGISHE